MKKVIYFICYVVGLLIGVSLLIFNYEAMDRDQTVLRYTLLIAGVLFVIPGLIQLIASLRPKRDENGNILPHKWYTTVVAVLALLWGIYMLIFPLGYNNNLSITLGVSLILAGLAQGVWIVRTSESTFLRFIVPIVTIAVGVLVCTVFNHYPDNGKSAQIGAIISGIMLIIWGVNGFFSLRSKRVVAAADRAAKEERKVVKEERKAEKIQAKADAKAASEAEKEKEKEEKDVESKEKETSEETAQLKKSTADEPAHSEKTDEPTDSAKAEDSSSK